MKRLILLGLAVLALAFAAFAAVPFGNVRTTPRRAPKLMAANNSADAGFDCFIGCSGEAETGLGVKVTAGTEISFDFDYADDFKPVGWTLNGVEQTLPPVNVDGASMTFAFTCLDNTHVFIRCRRPLYVDAATGVDVSNPSNEVSRGYAPANPFRSIQFAASHALEDAEIRVADGLYAPFSLTNSQVRIVHTNLQSRAVIDAQGLSRCAEFLVCYSNETEEVVEPSATNGLLRGFTLRNGCTSANGGGVAGGRIVNCEIVDCRAEGSGAGGGIYAAEARSSLIHGCSAAVGGGASDSLLVNCTVAANTATTEGGGLAHSCATNSVIFGNLVNGAKNELNAFSRVRYSVTEGVVFKSASDFRLVKGSPGTTEGTLRVLEDGETDLDGLAYRKRPNPTLAAGCYQATVSLNMPHTGLTVDGYDFDEIGCPIVGWDAATSTATLPEGTFTVAGTAARKVVLAGAGKRKTFVRFEPVVSVAAISDLTVLGGSVSATSACALDICGGNVSVPKGKTSSITRGTTAIYPVSFKMETWQPGSAFALTGPSDYDVEGLVPAADGTICLWLPTSGGKWIYLTAETSGDVVRRCCKVDREGSVTWVREADVGTFAVNGKKLYDTLNDLDFGCTYSPETKRVVIGWKGEYAFSGSGGNGLGVTLSADATVTLADVSLTASGGQGRLSSAVDLVGTSAVTLRLSGRNVLKAGRHGAGVLVPRDSSLTITTAVGAEDAVLEAYGDDEGAGIGSTYVLSSEVIPCGSIALRGGEVRATGGVYAPGIGACDDVPFKRIEISGGTVVARTESAVSAGIGCSGYGYGGEILISGGRIDAVGGSKAADIGWGAKYLVSPGQEAVLGVSRLTVAISGGTILARGGLICGTENAAEEAAHSQFLVTGGSLLAGVDTLSPTPTNGVGAVLRRVTLTLPTDWPKEAAVEVLDVPGYGTRDIWATDGKVYLWLPEGERLLRLGCRETGASHGRFACYRTMSAGACEISPLPQPAGFAVNGFDIALGAGVGWTATATELDITEPGDYTLSGSAEDLQVVVRTNATVTLDNVSLSLTGVERDVFALASNVTATVRLAGTNRLETTQSEGGDSGGACLFVGATSTLILTNAPGLADADARLETIGGHYAAGIGSRKAVDCGTIVIAGGTIDCSGSRYAPAIGSGSANISSEEGGRLERIAITGGRVRASQLTNKYGPSCIGCADYGRGADISISGGLVEVEMLPDAVAAPIGWGDYRYNEGTVRVLISGGTVNVKGGGPMITGRVDGYKYRVNKPQSSVFEITGGSLLMDEGTAQPRPKAGTADLALVTVLTPAGWPEDRPIPLSVGSYGCRDLWPIDGELYLHLPAGNHAFYFEGQHVATVPVSAGQGVATLDLSGLVSSPTAVTVNGTEVGRHLGGDGWTFLGDELTLTGPGPFVLSGGETNRLHVAVTANATVVLSNLTLSVGAQCESALTIETGVSANLLLAGTNMLRSTVGDSAYGGAGLFVPKDAAVTIGSAEGWSDDTAVLKAIGGGYAAAIGGMPKSDSTLSCGTIHIVGGTIDAEGGASAAGIGATERGSCGSILIDGGLVTARTRSNAQAAAIGCAAYGRGGRIEISGGRIRAVNGGYRTAAPVGWGNSYDGGDLSVTISGGTVDVSESTGGGAGRFIYQGKDSNFAAHSTLRITGGSVLVDADPQPAPTKEGTVPVRKVELDVSEIAADGEPVTIEGLGDYGLQDVVPVRGKICLWLPDGDYDIRIGEAHRYVTVRESGAIVASRLPDVGSLTVNGESIESGAGTGWTYDLQARLTLDGPGPFRLSGVGTNVKVRVVTDCSVVMSNLTLTVTNGYGAVQVVAPDVLFTNVYESAFTVANGAVVNVTFEGAHNRLEERHDPLELLAGAGIRVEEGAALRILNGSALISSVRGYCGSGMGRPGRFDIKGGSLDILADCRPEIVPSNGVSKVRRVDIPLPDGTPADRPLALSGLGGYGVRELYPSANNTLVLWLPAREYVIEVDGRYYVIAEEGDCTAAPLTTGVAVNGVDCAFVSREGWRYSADYDALALDGTVDYTLSSTNLARTLDIVVAQGKAARIVGGTLVWNRPIDGELCLRGGNLQIASSAFAVAPSNGTERVYPVAVTLPDDFPSDQSVSIDGLAASLGYDYGCAETYPIDGTLTIWLPLGDHRFTVNGIAYAASVDGRADEASFAEVGLRVDGIDVSAAGLDTDWSWGGFAKALALNGAHRLDGTNPVGRVDLLAGTVVGGTARITGKAIEGLVITGGSLKIEGGCLVPPSNGVERVYCVTAPVPYGVKDGDPVTITGPAYGSDGIVAMDGHVYLWLPGETNEFAVNGVPMRSVVKGDAAEAEYIERGLQVDGVDIGVGVGDGWNWNATSGRLTITGKEGDEPYLLAGWDMDGRTHVCVEADARLSISNVYLYAPMTGASAFSVTNGCTAELTFPGLSFLLGTGHQPGFGGDGRVVVQSGTAYVSSSDDSGVVATCAWEVDGGSIGIGSRDVVPVQPQNRFGDDVYLVTVTLPERREQVGTAVFERGNIPAYYDLSGINVSATREVNLWLPTNTYEFAINGDRYRAEVTEGGSTVTALYGRTGVAVNGIDCGLLHDTGWTYDPATGVLTVDGTGSYRVTGTNETGGVRIRAVAATVGRPISLAANNLVLKATASGTSPVEVAAGTDLQLSVIGATRFVGADGAVSGTYGGAGIHVPTGASLAVVPQTLGSRGGSLEAVGGALAAGIGGNMGEGAGSISFSGVNVQATGGVRAAGIGGGSRGAGGDVRIMGGEFLVRGGDGRDGDGLGGAGIGGGYLGGGGRTVLTGGFCEIYAGENAAAIGGGAVGDGGSVEIRGGTVFPHLRHPEQYAQDAAAIGGGNGGRPGANAFVGGSVVVTNALGETAADRVRSAPTNAVGAAVAGIVLVSPVDSAVSDHNPVRIVGLDGYGVTDVYPVGGKLYLWLPDNADGERYLFTVEDVGYELVVRDGKAEYLEYQAVGVYVNGVDCCFTNSPDWIWTPVDTKLTIAGGGTYVVRGEARRGDVSVVAGGNSTVVLSNFVASADIALPLSVPADAQAAFAFVGTNDAFRALGGGGAATIVRGNVRLETIADSLAKVVFAGGNVLCGEKYEPGANLVNPDGRRVWPVPVDLPAGCTNALPVAFEGLPPYYDATGVRDFDGKVCVWLPNGEWNLCAIGEDDIGRKLATNLTVVVTDAGPVPGDLVSVRIADDTGKELTVPVSWILSHTSATATSSLSEMESVLLSPSQNGGIPVWQSYVAGLDPNDPNQTFKAVIEVLDGRFVVQPSMTVADRIYWVIASPDIFFDPSRSKAYPLPASGEVTFYPEQDFRFFKVKVGFE